VEERLRPGGLVCLGDAGHLNVLPFDEISDPVTGRTMIRLVDTGSESYRVAREYMLRLETDDLADPELSAAIADLMGTTPEEVRARFGASISPRN
jgi:6-phosphofructokinase 1